MEAEVALEQSRFQAEQQARRDGIIEGCIPKLLGQSEADREEALAVLFTLYPNDADDILASVVKALGEEDAGLLERGMVQAAALDEETGSWAVVIGLSSDLKKAEGEVAAARRLGYEATIYLRESCYVTVLGGFPTQDEAATAKIALSTQFGRTAYEVNLNSWCPDPVTQSGYYECPTE